LCFALFGALEPPQIGTAGQSSINSLRY